MSTSAHPPAPAPVSRTGAQPSGSRAAAIALALGIAGLAAGFLVVPLLASVVAITMGSLGLQAVSEGRADASTARRLRTAIGCGVAALVVWVPVVVAAAVAES